MSDPAATVEITVATVGKARGVRGELVLHLYTDEPERRLAPGSSCRVRGDGRVLTVRTARWINDRFVVSFGELADRSAAETLRGAELVTDVPADERPAGEDEYYDRQLVGLRVVDAGGRTRGEVTEVLHLPSQDLLAVRTAGGERLVPFVAELVPEIDLGAGWLRLAEVPGLVDDGAVEAGDGR
ncbi:ribosome maturation factor RimM [Propionibacterium australiense]|uniref:Ribosome maturation factor RimM n=1 Tax=Propionibacterium australiense TaxID=119981 RepID=A0A383S9J1_9ACTN|nr:ribosome maturation factor RimM [Propionibacterium australiense]RLP06798.1 ribosome maturation factor RimM [Propionibacterium australiense]RLP06964.1 ribosome maturation factor RimM [Propionibacterium australiense]SYZ34039.1 Translation protein, beta-barrel domain [Propionibacterium australiense]VEH92093.1 Ribosome maturation factor rimM [Propionibacterium australiense]